MISTFQDASRFPLPAARKGPTTCAFAGSGRRAADSGQRVAGSVPATSMQSCGCDKLV